MRRPSVVLGLAGCLLSACASGPPVGLSSSGPGILVTPSASPLTFPGDVPADEPGPAVVQPLAVSGQPDPLVPGAIAYAATDPAVIESHSAKAVVYTMVPPVGGVHYPLWLHCGIYEQPVPTGYAVHDLEHGAIWISYRPDTTAGEISDLENFVRGARTVTIDGKDTGQHYLTLTPLPGQVAPLVLTAWGHQLTLQTMDSAAMITFIRAYRVKMGVTPEYGAACDGPMSVGTPLP